MFISLYMHINIALTSVALLDDTMEGSMKTYFIELIGSIR